MTYHSHGNGPMQAIGLYGALGGDCPQGSQYKAMIARADELERTWNPTGYYTADDMASVLTATAKLAGQASSAAQTFFAGNSSPRSKYDVRNAADGYWAVASRANDYVDAVRKATATKKPVAAPGFKRWVIDDLRAAAALIRAIEISACDDPWFIGTMVSFAQFFIGVTDAAKRIGKAVLNVGEAAVNAVEKTGDIVAFLLKWTPYVALGVGGYIAYNKYARK